MNVLHQGKLQHPLLHRNHGCMWVYVKLHWPEIKFKGNSNLPAQGCNEYRHRKLKKLPDAGHALTSVNGGVLSFLKTL
jgi:hypothetical protein